MLKAGWICIACATLVLLNGVARAQPQPIPIGIAAPLTGFRAALGQEIRRGAELAFDQINERGGVMGRKLVPVLMDDACSPFDAASVARKMVAERVVAVLGQACLGSAPFRAEAIYSRANIPVLVPTLRGSGQSPLLGFAWKNEFHLAGRFDAQGFVAGTYMARRFGNEPLALVREPDPTSEALEREFVAASAGREITIKQQVGYFQNDYSSLIDRLKEARVAAIYFTGGFARAAAFMRQARAAGLDATVVASSRIEEPLFAELAGDAGQGALFTFLPDARELPNAAEATSLFRRRDVEPIGYTLYAYAAVQVLAAAIEKAQSAEPDRLLKTLADERFETAIGSIKFDDRGDLVQPKFAFYEWKGRNSVLFDSSPHWTAPYQLPAPTTRDVIVRDAVDTLSLPGIDAPPFPDWEWVDRKGGHKKSRRKGGKGPSLVRVEQGVFWNVFFTRGDDLDARPNTKAASSYTLTLDLSAYNYSELSEWTGAASTRVDPNVKEHLRTAPSGPVDLKIRAMSVTPDLEFEGSPSQPMRIDRAKLVRPQTGPLRKKEETLVSQFLDDRIKTGDFSKQVRAGYSTFEVKVRPGAKAGCAVVAFAIFDNNNNPLDHLLQTVAIDDGSDRTDCGDAVANTALKGGFATLLDPAFSVGPGRQADAPIVAALHMFEANAPDGKKRLAIFVNKAEYAPADPKKKQPERGVYAWQADGWLSDFLGDPNGLPSPLTQAWAAAEKGQDGAYATSADELARRIFAATDTTQNTASAARDSLRKLSAAEDPPIVLVRLTNASNRLLYVPLSLIAAQGNQEGLTRPITVVQPLHREHYASAGPRCIKSWSFGMSPDTEGLHADIRLDIAQLNTPPRREEGWFTDHKALGSYVETPPATPAAANPEGFVLLAHHDGFGVYFNKSAPRIGIDQFKRKYSRGSIAMLASCATSHPKDDMAMLRTLNNNGIDAMIVSPFRIPVDYGARLAIEFTNIVRANQQSGLKAPSVAQIFSKASAAASDYFVQRGNKRMSDMALQFILVGDPYLKPCGN